MKKVVFEKNGSQPLFASSFQAERATPLGLGLIERSSSVDSIPYKVYSNPLRID